MKKRIIIFCIFLGFLTVFIDLKENLLESIGYLERTIEDKTEVLKNSIDDVGDEINTLKYWGGIMKNKFIILDTSCIIYLIFFCLYNITTLRYSNREYSTIYEDIFIFLNLIIFIVAIIQEKIKNKNMSIVLLLKIYLPIIFFSYLYKILFFISDVIDLFKAYEVKELLSISIPILIIEFLLEQQIYNFLRKKIIY